MLDTGAEFDRYRIEAQLGAGGMGTVYRAFDTRLQRRVALKVLRFEALPGSNEHADASARLVREAHAAAAFEHPNKVSIFDIGVHEGSPYIAMELVSGRPLRSFIGSEATTLATRITWLREIAQVLAAAHATGLVHRDVKPENVMIRDDGAVKVLDFGIARRVNQLPDGHAATVAASISTLTSEGVSLGTPIYMAPEQIRAEKLDGRVDQFAWGTMAYELLTGRHPWAQGRDLAGAIAAIASSEAPPLGSELGLPVGIESTINKALSKEPSQRFESFVDVVAALRGDAAAAQAGSTLVMPREGAPVAEGALAVTTKGGVAASVTPPLRSGSKKRTVVAGALVALGIAVATGFAVRKFVATGAYEPRSGLATLERFHNAKGSEAMGFESASPWRATQQDFEKATTDPRAPARWRAARAFAEGKLEIVADRVEPAVTKLREATKLDPDWVLPHTALCSALARLGRLDEALREAARAEQLEPDWWGGPAAAAAANAYASKLDQSIEDYRRALALSPERPLLLAELALVYHANHLDAEAVRLAARALELDPDLVSPRLLLAERALENSDGETALRESVRALTVLPQSLPARVAQADALVLLKREAEAIDAYRRAIGLWESGGRGGPFAERMQSIQRALDSGSLPVRTVVSPMAERSRVEAAKPSMPARSPVSKKPGAAPAAPKPRSAHDGRDGFDRL